MVFPTSPSLWRSLLGVEKEFMTLAFGLLTSIWNLHNLGAVAVCLFIGSIEPHRYALCPARDPIPMVFILCIFQFT